MKEIHLTGKRGGVALVDDEDYEALMGFKWNHAQNGYAYRYTFNPRRNILMHREIMNPEPGLEVDHINGNKLDNRRANLRVCDRRTNATNSGKRYPRGKYGRNVRKMKNRKKQYYVSCWYYGASVSGGYFEKLEEAQEAAAALRRKLGYVD